MTREQKRRRRQVRRISGLCAAVSCCVFLWIGSAKYMLAMDRYLMEAEDIPTAYEMEQAAGYES